MRYLTAGESHGKGLVTIVEGIPANLKITTDDINAQLAERQKGYGRGGRMKIEKDRVEIMSGIRHGKTLGSPISLIIKNKDWENWTEIMSANPIDSEITPITKVRPGHADLAGMIKYNQTDLRNILERSSARETAARVAAGAIARKYLSTFGIIIKGHVKSIGPIISNRDITSLSNDEFNKTISLSQLKCLDTQAEEEMKSLIDQKAAKGVSLGGIIEIIIENVPVGLGSYVHYDRKLDAMLAHAIISIQAFKGVEFGLGFEAGALSGDLVHDEIKFNGKRYIHSTNNAGGIEGGMSNGENIILRGAMKPIPTMAKALMSVDTKDKSPVEAHVERADVCAVPAACVVAENAVAFVIAEQLNKKLGGDSIEEQMTRWRELQQI